MEKKCGVIEDLLPLYVDGICSEESKRIVEEHIRDCKKCEAIWKNLKSDIIDNFEEINSEPDNADEVLKEVTLSISRKAIYTAVGIMGIILYWLIYIWQDNLAMYGDYRYFSYQFHEMYTIGWILVPAFTIVWLIRHLRKMIKDNTWKKDLSLLLALCLLFTWQFGIWYDYSRRVSVTALVTVKEVVDDYHIIINAPKGEVLLTVEPMVAILFETDGTMYSLGYETYKDKPYEGKLFAVWSHDIKQ